MSKPPPLAHREIPDGWSMGPVGQTGRFQLIKSPRGYMVTVDYDQRVFRTGLSTSGRVHSKGEFKGRGWKSSLIRAAVMHLVDSCGEKAR